jgi:Domain of unknown function (DUF4186)
MPTDRPVLAPLPLSCTRTDCEQGLHCFRESKRKATHPPGACRECGAELVDWERVQKRDPSDADYTFIALKHEWIRHQFWHADFDQRALNYALRKGRVGLREAAEQRIRSSVGKTTSRDGRQTPWKGNALYYAQHATACCCRRCIAYWHGIPEAEPLTEAQIAYFADLCLRYVFERMPSLPEAGSKVPPIRRKKRIS